MPRKQRPNVPVLRAQVYKTEAAALERVNRENNRPGATLLFWYERWLHDINEPGDPDPKKAHLYRYRVWSEKKFTRA